MQGPSRRLGRLAIGALFFLAACGPPPAPPEPLAESELPHFAVRGRLPKAELSLYCDPRLGAVPQEDFERVVDRAIETWNRTGRCELTRSRRLAEAEAVLSFQRLDHGTECPPFGTESTIAHSGKCEPGTFIHFDRDRLWTEDGERGHSLYQATLHELGHLLGLGHSTDEAALMHPATDRRRTNINRSDLAGLHTLYGGGEDDASDIELRVGVRCEELSGERRTVLRRVAPPERTHYSYFDSDGDGSREILVWRTDREGYGALTAYHLNRRLAVNRTSGPMLGTCPPGTEIAFGVSRTGERLILRVAPNDAVSVLAFDDQGVPRLRHQVAFELTEMIGALDAEPPALGPDADGDGFIDSRPEPRSRECAAWDFHGDLDGDGTPDGIVRVRPAAGQ